MRPVFAAVLFVLVCRPARAEDSSSRARQLENLLAQKKEADERFLRDFSDAGDDLQKNIARYDGWPGWQYAKSLVEFAEAAPEDPSALAACRQSLELCYAVGVTDRRIAATEDRAWSIIEKYHLANVEIGDLCVLAGRYSSPRRIHFLENVLADGPQDRRIRGLAAYGLAEIRFSQHTICELDGMRESRADPFSIWLRENREAADIEAGLTFENRLRYSELAKVLYQKLQADFADIPAGEGRGSARGLATLRERAAQRLYALEHLSIGTQAPQIEGLDLDGKPLRLSDFRGKVILVTFWFTGCGPCMGMLPQERQLVEDLRDKPFQMLSVCNDSKLETAKVTAAEKGITWPNWFDGPPWPAGGADSGQAESSPNAAGAIAKQWNVRGWPTIYVLDEKGIVRAKYLRGEGLTAKIHELVAAAEKP